MSRTRTTPWYLSVPLVDVLANPSVQRWLLIGLAVIAAAGVVTLFGVLWAARRPMPHRARVLRRRVGAVALFVVVAAGAAFALLATPVETETSASPPPPTAPSRCRRRVKAKPSWSPRVGFHRPGCPRCR